MLQGIHSAWQGWEAWIGTGKLPALFLAALLYLLIRAKSRGAQRKLVYYGSAAAVLAICPVTAAVLMKYQTAFYDYPFIWSLVPMTLVIAFGATVFLQENLRKGGGWRAAASLVILLAFCVMLLVLSGGMGPRGVYVPEETAAKERAKAVWQEMQPRLQETQELRGQQVCLWAPQEIMDIARREPVSVLPLLLYGRNMWDEALNAYTYDSYSAELQELYLWMEAYAQEAASGEDAAGQADGQTEAQGIGQAVGQTTGQADGQTVREVRQKVEQAFSLGANCVLLPKGVADILPAAAEWADVTELSEYDLLQKRS